MTQGVSQVTKETQLGTQPKKVIPLGSLWANLARQSARLLASVKMILSLACHSSLSKSLIALTMKLQTCEFGTLLVTR